MERSGIKRMTFQKSHGGLRLIKYILYKNELFEIISKSDFRAQFYSKLINNNLPHYFETFTPNISAGHNHYNFRNPSRLLSKIKHEFPKQSLRYKLIATLNETSYDLLEMTKTQSQRNFMNFVKILF